MAEVVVKSETDVPQGWRYLILVTHDDGSQTEHRLRLGWVDHNHWAGERAIPPSAIAEGVMRYLIAQGVTTIPDRFDAAVARRWAPDIDHDLDAHVRQLPQSGSPD